MNHQSIVLIYAAQNLFEQLNRDVTCQHVQMLRVLCSA